MTRIIDTFPGIQDNPGAFMAKPELASFLKGVPVFAHLSADRLAALASMTKIDDLPAGQLLAQDEAWTETIWIPVQGLVRVADHQDKSEGATIFFGARGEPIGCFDARCTRRHALSCILVVDSLVALLPRAQVLSLATNDTALSAALVKMLSDRLWECRELTRATTAERRLARNLLLLSSKLDTADIPLTRRALAEISGIARETTIRALSPIERAKVIRTVRGRIQILQRDKLEKLANG